MEAEPDLSAVSFSKCYLEALMVGVEEARKDISQIVGAAEAVVPRLVAGGDLYIASVRPDFVSEGYTRSGGLMMLKPYDPVEEPSEKDAVLVGWTGTAPDQDPVLLGRLQDTGAFTVGIGPAAGELSAKVKVFLESVLPLPSPVTVPFCNAAYPLVSLQNLILLWTFTGELVAALTRCGRMPAMYQSVLVPGARERNAGFRTHRFHQRHMVPSLPPGLLGGAYLDQIKSCLRTVCHQEIRAIEQVAQACADVWKRGNRIHAFLISHFPVHQAGAPGDAGFMDPLSICTGETPDLTELEKKLRPGDLFFFLGYYRRPVKAYEIVRRRACQIVEIITGTDEPAPAGPPPDYVIRPGWPYTDSLVPVPGYDIRILPASGILQTAIYWAVVGEMGKRLRP